MADTAYIVLEIQPEWVIEREAMGSKDKFWYRTKLDGLDWLFKYPQPNTGQHWAEKIAAELAARIDTFHAKVELALFQNQQGSATESFARDGRDLVHGNQILAGKVLGYDSARKFRQSDHTLDNIFLALEKGFVTPDGATCAKLCFASYLVLDALIGNTDRHHENWGILRERVGDKWKGMMAPTFDHASSLGRELLDEGLGKCRHLLLKENRIGVYAEKAPGAIYWKNSDKRGTSPLELVRRATAEHPDLFRPALEKLNRLDRTVTDDIIARVPSDWMSGLAREFALNLICYNLEQLKGLKP
jgi:hypothetical protein